MSAAADDRPITWSAGEVIPIRQVQHGVVRYGEAVIVVEDTPERLVVFAPMGGAMVSNEIDWETGAFEGPRIRRRHTTDALKIFERGAQHITSLFFAGGTDQFICWYVDLAEPVRRAGGGLVTFDRSLDIVIGPDRQWRWKDEDHFAHIQRFGWITSERAQELREEAERVIARVEAGDPPFDATWLDWRPDRAWLTPELPGDWDTPPA